jgi:hypothetical protein
MTQYSNVNRGAIWKNDDKREDNHPDFKGSINVDGVEYWVSAWKRREGAAAKAPALSFSIKPKDEQSRRQEPSITQRAQANVRRPDPISSGRSLRDELDDDLPF